MSVRTEWMAASQVQVWVAIPERYEDSYGALNVELAIVLAGDSDIVIEGSRVELESLVTRIREVLA